MRIDVSVKSDPAKGTCCTGAATSRDLGNALRITRFRHRRPLAGRPADDQAAADLPLGVRAGLENVHGTVACLPPHDRCRRRCQHHRQQSRSGVGRQHRRPGSLPKRARVRRHTRESGALSTKPRRAFARGHTRDDARPLARASLSSSGAGWTATSLGWPRPLHKCARHCHARRPDARGARAVRAAGDADVAPECPSPLGRA